MTGGRGVCPCLYGPLSITRFNFPPSPFDLPHDLHMILDFNVVFSRVLRDSTPRFVGTLVCLSVGSSVFTFSASMGFLALQLLPKCSTDFNYGPCPPAHD